MYHLLPPFVTGEVILSFPGVGQAMGAQNGFGRYPNKGMGESFG